MEGIVGSSAGGQLIRTFPVIDRFFNGVATSVKSLNLGARTYQNLGTLASKVNSFVQKLANFEGARLGQDVVEEQAITQRVLELVVKSASRDQLKLLAELAEKAQDQGVVVKIILAK